MSGSLQRHSKNLAPVWQETEVALHPAIATLRRDNAGCNLGFAKHFPYHNENGLAFGETASAVIEDHLQCSAEVPFGLKHAADLMELCDQQRFGV